jgi:hypothetical protein
MGELSIMRRSFDCVYRTQRRYSQAPRAAPIASASQSKISAVRSITKDWCHSSLRPNRAAKIAAPINKGFRRPRQRVWLFNALAHSTASSAYTPACRTLSLYGQLGSAAGDGKADWTKMATQKAATGNQYQSRRCEGDGKIRFTDYPIRTARQTDSIPDNVGRYAPGPWP